MAPKESEIQTAILKYLETMGYTVWRSYVGPIVQSSNRGSRVNFRPNPMAGYPDITGFLKSHPKQMFCIEVKAHNGKVSDKQKEWFELLDRHGVIVFVARSVQDVIDNLKPHEL